MRRSRIAPLLALTLVAYACQDSTSGVDNSRLTILLTDAPGDVTAAVVTISSIYLQGGSSEDHENGRLYLRTEPVTTDLVTLVDDVATLVDQAAVPTGTYGQLRFVIDGAYLEIETDSGSEIFSTPDYAEAPALVHGELHCPSCAQSGFKVNLAGPLELDEDGQTVLVDFDVAETFGKQAGNSGRWIMNPSLKASLLEPDSND